MRSHADPYPDPAPSSAYAGHRFPPEVITLAVRLYLGFGLSYRDVEELLAERGIEVDHVTIFRWVQRFAPEFAEAARARHRPAERPRRLENPLWACSEQGVHSRKLAHANA
jgi:IS6 family transposase